MGERPARRNAHKNNAYKNNVAIHGNNALKLDSQTEKHAPKRNRSRKNNLLKQRLKEEKANINLFCTFVNAFVIIATLAVCVTFLKTQYDYNELNKQIETKKQELSILKKENIQTREDIKNQTDLEYIYEQAVNRLGMHVPGPGDVYMISVEPLTYTTKYASVEVKESKTTLGNVLGYITRGW